MTPKIDARFERIARRLSTFELCELGEDDVRFVNAYDARGLHRVIDEYGLDAKLRAQGLSDYELVVTEEDPFRHRLEIRLPEGTAPDVHVMDLRLHLTRVAVKRDAVEGQSETEKTDDEKANVVVVEWLLMQNPRLPFTKERPRLPGQTFRGTGVGRDVAQLLVIMCRRIQREALVVVPERFHLAELYAKAGWRAASHDAERALDDVLAAASSLTFPARAWAVERGFVVDDSGLDARDHAPYAYAPVERILPVSERLERALEPGGFLRLARLLPSPAARSWSVDVDGLRASLRQDPVEGMDPDDVTV